MFLYYIFGNFFRVGIDKVYKDVFKEVLPLIPFSIFSPESILNPVCGFRIFCIIFSYMDYYGFVPCLNISFFYVWNCNTDIFNSSCKSQINCTFSRVFSTLRVVMCVICVSGNIQTMSENNIATLTVFVPHLVLCI